MVARDQMSADVLLSLQWPLPQKKKTGKPYTIYPVCTGKSAKAVVALK